MPSGTEKPVASLKVLPLWSTTMAWSLSSLPYSLQKNIKPLI
jgi:hypothetical protein